MVEEKKTFWTPRNIVIVVGSVLAASLLGVILWYNLKSDGLATPQTQREQEKQPFHPPSSQDEEEHSEDTTQVLKELDLVIKFSREESEIGKAPEEVVEKAANVDEEQSEKVGVVLPKNHFARFQNICKNAKLLVESRAILSKPSESAATVQEMAVLKEVLEAEDQPVKLTPAEKKKVVEKLKESEGMAYKELVLFLGGTSPWISKLSGKAREQFEELQAEPAKEEDINEQVTAAYEELKNQAAMKKKVATVLKNGSCDDVQFLKKAIADAQKLGLTEKEVERLEVMLAEKKEPLKPKKVEIKEEPKPAAVTENDKKVNKADKEKDNKVNIDDKKEQIKTEKGEKVEPKKQPETPKEQATKKLPKKQGEKDLTKEEAEKDLKEAFKKASGKNELPKDENGNVDAEAVLRTIIEGAEPNKEQVDKAYEAGLAYFKDLGGKEGELGSAKLTVAHSDYDVETTMAERIPPNFPKPPRGDLFEQGFYGLTESRPVFFRDTDFRKLQRQAKAALKAASLEQDKEKRDELERRVVLAQSLSDVLEDYQYLLNPFVKKPMLNNAIAAALKTFKEVPSYEHYKLLCAVSRMEVEVDRVLYLKRFHEHRFKAWGSFTMEQLKEHAKGDMDIIRRIVGEKYWSLKEMAACDKHLSMNRLKVVCEKSNGLNVIFNKYFAKMQEEVTDEDSEKEVKEINSALKKEDKVVQEQYRVAYAKHLDACRAVHKADSDMHRAVNDFPRTL